MTDISFLEIVITAVISLFCLRDSDLHCIYTKIYRFVTKEFPRDLKTSDSLYDRDFLLKTYSFSEHIKELRMRIIIILTTMFSTAVLIFPFCWDIIYFLAKPLILLQGDVVYFKFIYTRLTEAFVTELRIALVFGTLLSSPVIIYQIYRFFAPALYKNERDVMLPYLLAAPLLFLLGMLLVYYIDLSHRLSFTGKRFPLEI